MWRSFAASLRISTRARPMKVTPGGSRSRTTWTQTRFTLSSRCCARFRACTYRPRRSRNAGDHVERVSFGVPLFAVRGRDGRARVFRNACRHRGLALVEGPGCAHALVCRYHGWTYRLDGSLSHVPHADAFPDLDVPTRGLVEVDSREVDGLIVIGPLQPSATDSQRRARRSRDGGLGRRQPVARQADARRTARVRRLHSAADELEGSRRAVPRGLSHPLDAQGHLLSDSIRRSQRRRSVRPEHSDHVPLPEHRETS